MELIREILMWMEDHDERLISLNGFKMIGGSTEVTFGHLRMLETAGFVENPKGHSVGITWEGHEFLEKIRDPEIWKKTKEGASKLNSWGVKLLGEMATGFIKAKAVELGLPLQ